MNEAYFDRNQAVQALGRVAQHMGYKVGLRDDPEEPGWPVLVIDLPTGQVSWHLPAGEVIGSWDNYGGEWDGHTVEDKRRRIKRFVRARELTYPYCPHCHEEMFPVQAMSEDDEMILFWRCACTADQYGSIIGEE